MFNEKAFEKFCSTKDVEFVSPNRDEVRFINHCTGVLTLTDGTKHDFMMTNEGEIAYHK